MLNVSELTNGELLLISWGLSRIPSYLLGDRDEEVRNGLMKGIRDEKKKRGVD